MLYILTLYKPVGCCDGGLGGRGVGLGRDQGVFFCWGTMHKLYRVWIKKNHVCIYLYTCVYVYIYAYQQINKKK